MTLRLNGSTSGYIEIDAPAVAGTTALTFPATTGTVAITGSNTWTGTQNFTGATLTGAGMDLIVSQSFTSAGSFDVNNIFSTTYDNYAIRLRVTGTGSLNALGVRMRVSGTNDSSTNYFWGEIKQSGGTVSGTSMNTAATSAYIGYNGIFVSTFDVFSPFLTIPTFFSGTSAANTRNMSFAIRHEVSTSYTGLNFDYQGGGSNSGTIQVYGYRK
jgi:hypothetical protein